MSDRLASRIVLAAIVLAVLLVVAGVAVRPDAGERWLYLPIVLPFAAVGALLAWKLPANPIGWLFLAFGVVGTFIFAIEQYGHEAIANDPGSLPAGNLAASIGAHGWHPAFGLFVFSFLLFPNGHLLSPRWRWVARATVVVYLGLLVSGPFDADLLEADFPEAHPLFSSSVTDVGSIVFGLFLFANLGLLALSAVSLLLRLKRSRGEERQQLKVFVYTVAFVTLTFPTSVLVAGDGRFVAILVLVPVSAAVAIFRYRLWDIDVVINRTLVYGALTATLAGTYLGSVLLLQLLLSPSSDLAIAGSTLAVAALFRPARARIQAAVDRRFYRRRYDAAHTLERFGGRLRDEVDLDALGHELRGVIGETMQPAHVSLWLREAGR